MGKGMHIKINGQKELRDKLHKLPKRIRAAEVRAVKDQTETTADRLRRDAPVDKGDFRRSIQEEIRNEGMTGVVAITDPDATHIIHGTSDTPAHDVVTPALNSARRQFPKTVARELEKELRGKG